ncbi:MAG: GNAT family N-acetyltransferase [Paracoccaceae bacterium]|nr:GNAT family N-acetyltransferase [Paracoccaceae bacterium]
MTLTLNIPTLTTTRLTLRPPREADFPAMLAFNESPRTVYVGGTVPRQQVWRSHLANIGHWALRGYGFWSVDTQQGEFVGRVGVIYHDGWPEPELAWHVFANGEGKGYAHEAALAARADAGARLGLGPLISMIDPENRRSIALAERLGARFERADPGLLKPFHVYRHPEAQS